MLLELNNLTIRFPGMRGDALSAINLCIDRDETLALVGESGSGKSLTALALMRLLPPAAQLDPASRIVLDGEDLTGYAEIALRGVRGRRIGMIFQEASAAFNPVMTIGAQIDEALKRHCRLTRRECNARVCELLHEVGIPDPPRCAASYPHQLSGGMRQRAMIAMALAPQPDLIIADEPTTALDAPLQAQIIALLRAMQTKYHNGLLFITHDLGLVQRIADRVAVIAGGKIVEQASVAQFFAHPQHPYSQRLFAAQPSWDKRPAPVVGGTETAPVLLTAQQLSVRFPLNKRLFERRRYFTAVDAVHFDLRQGQTYALIGESGSGKTTVAKALLRLVAAQGDVEFLGQPLLTLSTRQLRRLRGDAQLVFQDPYTAMNPRLRVGQIIAEGMLAQRLAKNYNACLDEVAALLARVGLPADAINRFPHQFSGGQRQRICIARAVAMRPKLIICDEPTSALDVVVQWEILQLLRALQRELGITYLLITHNIAVVAYLADEVAVMRHGAIVEAGAVEQILFHPRAEYTKQLVAAAAEVALANPIK